MTQTPRNVTTDPLTPHTKKPTPSPRMAKQRSPIIYKLTVQGEYYAYSDTAKLTLKKPFKISCILSSLAKPKGYLSVIKDKILKPQLKKEYPDYKNIRKFDITHAENLSDPDAPIDDLDLMGFTMLQSYIESNDLPVDYRLCANSHELRQAIQLCETDPSRFLQSQKIKQERFSKEYEVDNMVRELNPELFDDVL